MTTKIYLHSANTTVAGSLPINHQGGTAPTTQGGISPFQYPTGSDTTSVNRSMTITKGTSQTSIAITSIATVTSETYYLGKWVSRPLNQTSIAANTWSCSWAIAESNLNANFQRVDNWIYVWRPSTGALVGFIAANTIAGFGYPTIINTETLQTTTDTGSAVTCQVGDVIIIEAWARITQGSATAYTDTLYFDGATENAGATGITVSDIASFISTPENISFTVPLTTISLTETKTISDAVSRIKTLAGAIVRTITETVAISESKLRRVIRPLSQTNLINENLTIVKRIIKSFTETTSIAETKLRRPIPSIPTEITSISEGTYGFTEYFTSIFMNVGDPLRKPIPKLATQITSILETLIKKSIPKIIAEVRSISDSVTGFKTHVKNLIETIRISDAGGGFTSDFTSDFVRFVGLNRLYQAFRNLIEGQCSIYFNGQDTADSGNYVQLGGLSVFTNTLSVTAWVKFVNDESGYGGIISYMNGEVGSNNRLLLSGDNRTVLFQLNTSISGITNCSFTMPSPGFLNNWHHFGATYDGSNMKLYIDGFGAGDAGFTNGFTSGFVTTPFGAVSATGALSSGLNKTQIGWGSNTTYHLDGNISELALYNVALTSTEISNVYNNGTSTVTRGMTDFYKFNEGSGTVVHDSIGTRNGTIINDSIWLADLPSPVPEPSIYAGQITEKLGIKRLIGVISQTISIAESLVKQRIVPRILNEITRLIENTIGFTNGFTTGFADVGGSRRKFIPFMSSQVTTISDSLLRRVLPKIAAQITTISEILQKGRVFTLREIIGVSEGSGYTSGYTSGYDYGISGIKRKFLPFLSSQTTSIIEKIVRKLTPLIATQSTAISDAITKIKGHFIILTETILIVESRLRKSIPKLAVQTVSISETRLRKVFPTITTQSSAISDSVGRFAKHIITAIETVMISEARVIKIFRKITVQTVSITETQLRKFIPVITIQIIAISESQLRRSKPKISAEITIISDSLSRLAKFFRTVRQDFTYLSFTSKSYSTVTGIIETQLRKSIPKLAAQTTTISDTVAKVKGRFVNLVENTAVVESLIRIAKHFRIIIETKSVSESVKRVLTPKIIVQTTAIVETQLRKLTPKIQDQLIVPISESLKKKPIRVFIETISVSDSIKRKLSRIITETISIAESKLRKVIRPFVESVSISETRLRKFIPKVGTQTITISDVVAKLRNVTMTIIENISISETLRRSRIVRSVSQAITISETRLRTFIPKISIQSNAISDAVSRKLKAIRSITDTISIIETQLRKPIPKITTQIITISESLLRRVKPYLSEIIAISESMRRRVIRPLSQTAVISESLLRNIIPKIAAQSISISDSMRRRVGRIITDITSITEVLQTGHKFVQKFLSETVAISETLRRISKPNITLQSLAVSDAIGRKLKAIRSRLETTVISESLSTTKKLLRSISTQTVAISDSISRLRTVRKFLTEIITITEAFARLPANLFSILIGEQHIHIRDRLDADHKGLSWRWIFQPWNKSSFTNRFTPKRKGDISYGFTPGFTKQFVGFDNE